jgi:hypothetical protein
MPNADSTVICCSSLESFQQVEKVGAHYLRSVHICWHGYVVFWIRCWYRYVLVQCNWYFSNNEFKATAASCHICMQLFESMDSLCPLACI